MSIIKGGITEEKRCLFIRKVIGCLIIIGIMSIANMGTDKICVQAAAVVAQNQATTKDTVKNGVVKEGRNFYYYKDNVRYTKTGWVTTDKDRIKINSSGRVVASYHPRNKVLSLYKAGVRSRAKNITYVLNDGRMYLFGGNGAKITTRGWYRVSGNLKYKLGSNGVVTAKYVRNKDVIRMARYDKASRKWKAYKKTWQSVDNKEYYLNRSGVCTKIYDRKTRKASELSSGRKFKQVRNSLLILKDNKTYFFNSKGLRITKNGWYTTSDGVDLYIGRRGNVTTRIYKKGRVYRLYRFNNARKNWTADRGTWVKTKTKQYYFSASGAGTVIYDRNTQKLYRYSSAKKQYNKVTSTIHKMDGVRYYYYSKSGTRITTSGWKRSSNGVMYYVGKNGYVISKCVDKNGVKRLYNINYSKNKWVKRSHLWTVIGDNKYYFGSNGIASVCYNTKSQRAYVYKDKKWKSVKKSIKRIDGVNYYFSANGRRESKAGVYKTANGYLAYVNRRGVVYKREYDLSVKRYYDIDLGRGKTEKVYGYYELDSAKSLMDMVNQHRVDNGLPQLTISSSLTETATTRAKEISYKYSHYRPDGTLCLNSMYELYGENLAGGFASEDLVFRAWNKSTAHDSNMLGITYKTMGAAVFVALDRDKAGYKRYYVLTFGK